MSTELEFNGFVSEIPVSPKKCYKCWNTFTDVEMWKVNAGYSLHLYFCCECFPDGDSMLNALIVDDD